jgi:tetratricopeptide (TPR) repeat protein
MDLGKISFRKIGKYSRRAMLAFDEVIRLNPKNTYAWYHKGVILYNSGKYEGAIQAFDEVIKLDRKNSDAWYYKGVSLHNIGKCEDAVQAFDEVIRLNPENTDAWYHKDKALRKLYFKKMSKSDKAILTFDNVNQLDPVTHWWLDA